jgi:hypothetical protein
MSIIDNGSLEGEFRAPYDMPLKNKVRWYEKRYREVLLNNSFSEAKKETLKKYAESLEQVIDYLNGIGDYRKLTNEARRIVMFLLSTNKAWFFQTKLCNKKPEEVLKFISADFLPNIRKQIILDFIIKNREGMQCHKLFEDWEIKIMLDEKISKTQAMYMTGRTYGSIKAFRKKRHFKRKD